MESEKLATSAPDSAIPRKKILSPLLVSILGYTGLAVFTITVLFLATLGLFIVLTPPMILWLDLGLVCASLLIALLHKAVPQWTKRSWGGWFVLLWLWLVTFPLFFIMILGFVLENGAFFWMYAAVQALFLASFVSLNLHMVRSLRKAQEQDRIRRIIRSLGASATFLFLLVVCLSSSYRFETDRCLIARVCEEIGPDTSREDIERIALENSLERPAGRVPEDGTLWLAKMVGRRGWHCWIRLKKGEVSSTRYDWLVLD